MLPPLFIYIIHLFIPIIIISYLSWVIVIQVSAIWIIPCWVTAPELLWSYFKWLKRGRNLIKLKYFITAAVTWGRRLTFGLVFLAGYFFGFFFCVAFDVDGALAWRVAAAGAHQTKHPRTTETIINTTFIRLRVVLLDSAANWTLFSLCFFRLVFKQFNSIGRLLRNCSEPAP